MRIDLRDITAIPGRFGLGFVTDLLNSLLGVSSSPGRRPHHHWHESSDEAPSYDRGPGRPPAGPPSGFPGFPGSPGFPGFPPESPSDPIDPPTDNPGIDDELEGLVGRQVLVNTMGGQVSGVLAVARPDYLVLNNGTDFLLVPTARMQGIVTVD
ncbi:DUF2642 domain-containing protein [Cytobacillus gottheilii]|uniref:DUF2642 domain-containing protein n=1 Tax=Cytobacillus gottheilii TaxID=859144 RepID=UPI0009BA62E6|nr:DUF2642 domain-containing protein [Cytobacillus gottheilii]